MKKIFSRYKYQISFTFFLLTIEAILLVLIPFGIGKSIDSLIKNSFDGIYFLFAILFLLLVVSTSRRLYDTRVYSKIYAITCAKLIKKEKQNNTDDSIVVTRSNLIKELVDFFEYDLTAAYLSLIGVIGALVMVAIFSIKVFILQLLSVVLIVLVYKFSENSIYNINKHLNNELEERLNIIKGSNIFLIPHFKRISNSMINLSDIESLNYIFIQIFIGIVIVLSLFIGVMDKQSTGNIFAMLTYVLNFSFELITLPVIYQQFIRLKEITNRIQGENR